MRTIAFLAFSTAILGIIGCNDNEGPNLTWNYNSSRQEKTIYSGDTLIEDLGSFGQDEKLEILSTPKNARSFSILEDGNKKSLEYISEKEFLGLDSILLVTTKGGNGVVNIDSVKIVIRILFNEFHEQLIGTWNWDRTCDKIEEKCVEPAEIKNESISFDVLQNFVSTLNGQPVITGKYEFLGTVVDGNITAYLIGVENKDAGIYFFDNDLLFRNLTDSLKIYKKVQ